MLKKVKNKQIYEELVVKVIKVPTAIEAWIEAYPFFRKSYLE